MYVDFHTHGKLAKYLPLFHGIYRLASERSKMRGLDAICLTEHFNTQQFELLLPLYCHTGNLPGRCVCV